MLIVRLGSIVGLPLDVEAFRRLARVDWPNYPSPPIGIETRRWAEFATLNYSEYSRACTYQQVSSVRLFGT